MLWADIRNLYVSMTGSAPAAASEWHLHANEALIRLCASLDLQELEDMFEVEALDGEDFVQLPADVYHIRHVDNITRGSRMEPEPSGMRSRSQYLEANSAKPPEGEPNYYVASNRRLYIRPTADDRYTFRIDAKRHPEEVTDDDLGLEPILPKQYRMFLAQTMAQSFLLAHPEVNQQVLEGGKIMLLSTAIDKAMSETALPKERERFDQTKGLRLRGYTFRFR